MTSSTPEPTPPLTDDDLAEMRTAVAEVLTSGDDYVSDEVKDIQRLLAEVDGLRAERDALAAKLDDARGLRRSWLADADDARFKADNLDGLTEVERAETRVNATQLEFCARQLGRVLGPDEHEDPRQSATTPPEEAPMPERFRETAGNLNTAEDVQDNLNATEQAAAEALDRAVFDSDATLVTDDAREKIARAVAAAVRGPIYFEAADILDKLVGSAPPHTIDGLIYAANHLAEMSAARQSGEGQH